MRRILAFCWVLFLGLAIQMQAAGPVIITEFMASNTRTLADEDGTYSDWIEIQNVGGAALDMNGWYLTDDPGTLRKWRFPTTNLPPSAFMVVFASAKDRIIPGQPLHTNFRLDAGGEYLALIQPDGVTVASEFRPLYPTQFADVGYGWGLEKTNMTLVPSNSMVKAFVPVNADLSNAWMLANFDDSGWIVGTNAVGFDLGTANPGEDSVASLVAASAPNIFYRLNESSGTSVANLGSILAPGTCANVTLNVPGPRPAPYGGYENNNTAAQFNGSSSYITAGGSYLNNVSAFTMAGWVSFAAAPAARTGLFGQNDAVEFGFSAVGTLQIWTPGGGSLDYGWSPTLNQWYHLAVVGDGSNLRVYLNGTQVAVGGGATSSYGSSSSPVNIGGGGVFDASGNWFNGVIDEVAVWTRALSAAEIQQQYQGSIASTATAVYTNIIQCDVGTAMFANNSSCFARYLFQVDDPSQLNQLTLNLKYDDGFAAYINGALVAWRNTPAELLWNSPAITFNSDGAALIGEAFNISGSIGSLVIGTNVLAIHGLNTSATNSDFLIGAELTAISAGAYSTNGMYFTLPTPGNYNGTGTKDLGPVISGVGHIPGPPMVPTVNDSILVTARVEMAFSQVTNVTLYYRVMYGATNVLPMLDDGLHNDGMTNDRIFAATIPAGVAANGQMLRWYITATDRLGRTSRWPVLNPTTPGPEYEGTMILDPLAASQLQIWYFFVDTANRPRIDTESGGRISMFYEGEFYDNIYMELRGNTTAGYPKKSHRIEFTPDKPLKGAIPGWDIRHTSLLSEQADPAYVRTHLSFWLLNQMGVPAPVHYPVHCRLNGQFWGLWFHNDVVGAEQLERLGYDPLGALYKAAGTIETSHSSTGGFEKKTRLWESTQDFDTMAAAINNTQSLDSRKTFIFDNLNLPEIINYLAVARWTQEGDDVWANMTLYRDTLNTREWFVIPFDMNVSWGQLYCGDDPSTFSTVIAANDSTKSHPLYGGSQVPIGTRPWNRIYDVIIAVPETRQMLLRRMRTMLERYIQPPGTSFEQGILEQHISALTNIMWTEMFLDRAAWGWPCNTVGSACGMYCWGQAWPTNTSYGVPSVIDLFIKPRRTHWWVTHCITNTAKPVGLGTTYNSGIPESQPTNAVLLVADLDFNPVTGNQDQEYVCLTNPQPVALDISGWRLEGAVNFTFAPGTIMPSNSLIYVTPDVYAFRSRPVGPRGGQGLFVVGPYQGQLSARGETIEVWDDTGRMVSSRNYTGNPSLAQQFLRITEIMYSPLGPAVDPYTTNDYEYIELKNISTTESLDLTGVRFTSGITFDFTGSAITALAPGASVLLVRQTNAFVSRYGTGLSIAGQYYSYILADGGERLRLVDAKGEEILDFSYNNSWYPITDGLGFSLVVVDENAAPDEWNNKRQWRPSGAYGGSPGIENPAAPSIAPIQITEALSRSDNPPPTDTIELFNPTTNLVNISGWYLTDDFNTPAKFRIPPGTTLQPLSFITFDESHFNPVPGTPPSFALSADGDEVYLFGVDTNTGYLNGYYHGFSFGAAEPGVSFGRHVTSDGEEDFVAQIERSLGSANVGPRVGPIVISEIMYHPPDLGATDNTLDEFIELLNITSNTVPLYYEAWPTNTWKLTGGADFIFPTNVSLAPGEALLILNFDPTNTAQLAAFRTLYNVAASVQVFGPYSGKLNNDSDELKLKKPTLPIIAKPDEVPYVLVERVKYRDEEPWPKAADGLGFSLQRWDCAAYGNEPTNWVCALATPGIMLTPSAGFPRIVTQPLNQMVMIDEPLSLGVSVTGDEPIFYQWRFNGNNLLEGTNALLFYTNAVPELTGDYDVLIQNAAGAVLSKQARVIVRSPLSILQQPEDITVRVAPDPGGKLTNATFSVEASSIGTLRYQWRANGVDIPDATNASYTIMNVATNHWGNFAVLVSDEVSSELSKTVWLYPIVRLQVVQGPVSQRVPVNSRVTLSARVSGWPPPFSFEWSRSGTAVVTNRLYEGMDIHTYTAPPTAVSQSVRVTVRNVGQPGGTSSSITPIITVADADGDGIADEWETLFGFSGSNPDDQLLDTDGDGFSNLEEYMAGTDPTNTVSHLKINALSWTAENQVRLDFSAASNKTYTVQGAADLNSSNWWTVGHVYARSTNWTAISFDASSPTNRFYRILTPAQK